MVISSVNFFEILYASTYDIYKCIYKVKKMPRLVRGYQPPRAAAAQFALARITTIVMHSIVILVEGMEALAMFFMY